MRRCVLRSYHLRGFFFFFSSRRRHTRYIGDWSSDVCSSDLCDTKGFDAPMILDGFARYIDAHRSEPLIAAALIGHPKLMFARERELLCAFVDGVRARYGARLSFATATEAGLSMKTPGPQERATSEPTPRRVS